MQYLKDQQQEQTAWGLNKSFQTTKLSDFKWN